MKPKIRHNQHWDRLQIKLSNIDDTLFPTGKNPLPVQPSPKQHDNLNLLIVNKLMWLTRTGGRWSDDSFYPNRVHTLGKPVTGIWNKM